MEMYLLILELFFIGRMGLVNNEEIMNISLWVWAANHHILCWKYFCLLSKQFTWLNLDSAIYDQGKAYKMSSMIAQIFQYFASVFFSFIQLYYI